MSNIVSRSLYNIKVFLYNILCIWSVATCYSLHSKLGLNAVPRNEQGLIIDPQEASFHLLYETVESANSNT